MGESLIDIRVWFAALVIVFGFGRLDLARNAAPVNDNGPDATADTCKSTAMNEAFGQHLVLDMKGINTGLLESEESLIKLVGDPLGDTLGLNLLSFNCQTQSNQLVSCLGVLDKAQTAIQAWPKSGAIAIDVFSEGSESLVPVVPVLKAAFNAEGDDAISFWSIDYRGETVNNRHTYLYHSALNTMISKVKKEVLSTKIDGQAIDVWEMVDIDGTVSHETAIAHKLQPGDPRWTNNELATPRKDVYLNGQVVATNDQEHKPFLEVFVHPGMMTQENPKQIAIVGGVAQIVPEILKHEVETVTFFQPEEMLISIVREQMPDTYNCSDLAGHLYDCWEDNRFTWVKEAAKSWFTQDRFGAEEPAQKLFDVIYTRVAQPPEAEDLSTFVGALMNGLSPNGALVISLGKAPTILHPRGDIGYYASHEKLFRSLESQSEVDSMMVFEDDFSLGDTSREVVPDAFLVVCKSKRCRQRFYAAPEEIDSQLVMRAKNGNLKMIFYDGALHASFQVVPKAYETVYCRRDPMPFECAYRTMDYSRDLFEFDEAPGISQFSLKESGVFATVDIPEGSFIMAKDLARSLLVSVASVQAVRDSEDDESKTNFLRYIDTFSHASNDDADQRIVEIGVSHLIRSSESGEEANIGRWVPSQKRPAYSPVYDRHSGSFDVFLVATKDIPVGGELVKLAATWED